MGNDVFSYTKRDYEGSRQEGLAKIPIISNGMWTDLNTTDPGIVILDYVHALVDMVNYYQDHQALESFITTAKERANIFRLAKQLSFRINSAQSAKVEVTFTSPFAYDHIIKIPKHTKIITKSDIEYMTEEDAYLPAGENVIKIVCVQGRAYQKVYRGTGLSRLTTDIYSENVNQTVELTAKNIDINSITIKDNLGRVWKPVDFIIFSTEIDRVYQADLNPDNSITIRFGDGERGIVPSITDELTIDYIVCDAEDGKVAAGSINTNISIYEDNGNYIEFLVKNEEASTGGTSAQSSSEIRELAPGAIKAMDRAVTLTDFENLARLVPGVADAKAYDININPSIPYHEVRVLVIPKEDSPKLLLNEVYKYLYKRMIPPTNLQVAFPSDINIDISITIKKMDDIADGTLINLVIDRVNQYFRDKAGEIGEDFYPADLATRISSLESVKYIMSMTPSNVVTIDDLAVAKLGKLNVTIQ